MKHSELGTNEIHRVHDREFSALDDLFAATTITADIGKVFKCTEGNGVSFYVVRSAGTPGTYSKMADGRTTKTDTTDATETSAWSLELADATAVLVTAKVLAMENDGTDRNAYHIQGLFYRTGAGDATQQGSTASLMTAIESDASWACVFDTDTNDVRLRVTGDAGTEIVWVADIEIIHYVTP